MIARYWITLTLLGAAAAVVCRECWAADRPSLPDRLTTAYEIRSYVQLDDILTEWDASSARILLQRTKMTQSRNAVVSSAEEIFVALTDNMLAQRSAEQYWIIQSEMIITVTADPFSYVKNIATILEEDEWAKGDSLVITRFAPSQLANCKKVLLLDRRYQDALVEFLSNGKGPHSSPTVSSSPETKEKLAFLRNRLPVMAGHWFGWHLETHPSIQHLWLDPTCAKAAVQVRQGQGGKLLLFEKNHGRWRIIESVSSWVE